jgi:hypothetical protein
MWGILFHRNQLQFAYLAEPGGGVNASSDAGRWGILFHRNLVQLAYLAEPGDGVNASSDVGQVEHSVPQEPVIRLRVLVSPLGTQCQVCAKEILHIYQFRV